MRNCCINRSFFLLFFKGFALPLLLLFSGCTHPVEDPILTQVKVRSMQTRTYVGYSPKKVLKEALAILQDEGYMIKSVNAELGIITAELSTNIEKFVSKFFAYLFSGKRARWKKQSVLELTMNVTEEKDKTKLRMNFQLQLLDNLGRVLDIHPILEEKVYEDFFSRIQKGLLTSY